MITFISLFLLSVKKGKRKYPSHYNIAQKLLYRHSCCVKIDKQIFILR